MNHSNSLKNTIELPISNTNHNNPNNNNNGMYVFDTNQNSLQNVHKNHNHNHSQNNGNGFMFSSSFNSNDTINSNQNHYYNHNGSRIIADHQQKNHNTSNIKNTIVGVDHWRSVLDNVFIEFLGSLFIVVAEIMYADWTDPWTQLIPAIAICGALICLKDGDCFFPDATPTVTLLMWSAGAYDNSWIQPCARIAGQCLAGGVAIAMWRNIDFSDNENTMLKHAKYGIIEHVYPFKRSHASLFMFEMLSTTIEHMAAIYLFIPMLPMISQGKVRAKHHHETEAPAINEVMYAALAFGGIHWALRMSFMGEMNPLVTVVRACVLWYGKKTGEEMLVMLWSEIVGVIIAMVYITNYYAPRKHSKKSQIKNKSLFIHPSS